MLNTLHRDITPDNLALAVDLQRLHGYVSKVADTTSPRNLGRRAERGLLFRVDVPGQQFSNGNSVTITWRTHHDTVPELTAGETLSLTVRLACEHRRTTDNWTGRVNTRGRKVMHVTRTPVRDEDVWEWVQALLARHGFALDAEDEPNPLIISPARPYGTGRQRFWIRDVTARVIVADSATAAEAIRNGVGRGKNYGLGMLIPASI